MLDFYRSIETCCWKNMTPLWWLPLVPDRMGERNGGRIYDWYRMPSDYFSDFSVWANVCCGSAIQNRLQPCRWRLVSADSLLVQGELGMSVAFPGLQCDMMLVVVSIGSEGLLGMEALWSCLPHQLDLRMGQLWADGQSTLQLHQTVRRYVHWHIQKGRW